MSGLPPAAAPSSSLPGSEPSPPYRPRFNTNGTAAKPMKRAENSYGSGWSQQRSSASASWTSGSSHNNNINNNGYQPSNTNINSFPPPKRTNSGPPSWVSKDAADSSSSWRTNNPKRPQPGSSTSPVSTSPQTPRSPNSFGGRGPFPPKSATNGGASKRPFGGQYLRPPSVARSSASHSERDSSWESASTATDTTWNNRFASLGGNDEDDEDDGDETASDNSGGLDSQRFEQAVNSLVNQDDEYDDLSVVMRSPSDLSTNWRKAVEPVISFVEIAERDVKKSGLIKDGNFKMWRCIPHNTLFKIHVYVPGNENGL
ncbi:hypothetical protein FRC15_012034 [Serendipita sp. 397]|nr:hypothetical protein FRC15_012034 [Serendipita sp. 397]